MKRTTIIEVTAADIERANEDRKQGGGISCFHCPLAQALKRQYPSGEGWRASPYSLIVYYYHETWRARSTPTIRRFMRRWDRSWQAVPARFRVEIG